MNDTRDNKKPPAEQLATPVQFLKGVGPQRGEMLARLGLRTAAEVLFFFPRDYQDMTDRRDVPDLEEGILQSVCGVVEEFEVRSTSSGGCVLGVLVRCKSGHVRGLWFNQPFMNDKFSTGQRVVFSGKPKMRGMVWEFNHPRVEMLGDDEDEPPGKLLPVYGLTEGIPQWSMRKIVQNAVESYGGLLDEVFPAEYLDEHDLRPLQEALPQIHCPEDKESLARARRRFVYQELFILQLAVAIKRHRQQSREKTTPLVVTAKIDARITRLFPFELTPGQRECIEQIAADLGCDKPMNRLLQGDVGSGKTVVAVYAMLLAVACGSQAVMMAPTEVLTRQHTLTLDSLLQASKVRRVQLTGGLASKKRAAVIQQIAAGEVDIVVGTQAIIQEDVEFKRLGLVVIDEQHKFGVRQRAMLRQAGLNPHYLVMTATPIPRTVTMTLFGDLDVSTIRDTPPGRQKINPYLAGEDKRPPWWEFFRKKLTEGRQAYVVTPLVDESDDRVLASLEETYEALANGELE
ncbi:MAG: ATP-dependent DNA helicase RecG, partial [Thermoguttaceae bacterium]